MAISVLRVGTQAGERRRLGGSHCIHLWRALRVDPGDPQSFNRYSYVVNNPLSFIDPSGFAPCEIAADCNSVGGGRAVYEYLKWVADHPTPWGIGSPYAYPGGVGGFGAAATSGQGPAQAAAPISAGPVMDAPRPITRIQVTPFDAIGDILARPVGDLLASMFGSKDADGHGYNVLIGEGVSRREMDDALPNLALLVITGGEAAPESIVAREGLVIGRGAELAKPGALRAGEYSLKWESKLPNFKAEWGENAGRLREVMRQGNPIRDISPGDTGGMFLNAERALLRDRGWTFNSQTGYWMPPGP